MKRYRLDLKEGKINSCVETASIGIKYEHVPAHDVYFRRNRNGNIAAIICEANSPA